jgi:hypothetical protein
MSTIAVLDCDRELFAWNQRGRWHLERSEVSNKWSREGRTMFRLSSVALVLLLFVPNAVGQEVDRESETMQALLSEIRELRRDLQAAAVAARRAQIVICRLHEQAMAVERATKRWENAKSAVAQTQMQRKYNAYELQRLEENKDRIENAVS